MNKLTIEQRLIAARPYARSVNTQFTDAVMASLPKSEIISSVLRTTNVKPKETFIMKLRQLHRPAIIAIAVGLTFLLAGSAYAIYSLWPKPTVETTAPTVNSTGRLEVSALFDGCQMSENGKVSYELKKGTSLPPEKIPQILQAQCEMKAIEAWTRKNTSGLKEFPDVPNEDTVSLNMPVAYKIESMKGKEIKLAGAPHTAQPEKSVTLSQDTKVIIDNVYSDTSKLKPGDVIVPASKLFYKTVKNNNGVLQGDSWPYKREVIYVFKMNLPVEAYDSKAFQSLAQKIPCYGNETEMCVASGGVELFGLGGQARASGGEANGREIQGKLTAYDASGFSVQGSSGKILQFTMRSDVITDYNTKRAAQHYQNVKVELGDMVSVRYLEASDTHASTIDQSQIQTMIYMIEVVNKLDPIKKY